MTAALAAPGLLSVRLASRIYGEDSVPLDDPAEHYHEASKLYPSFAARTTRAHELEHDLQLQASCMRAVRRDARLDVVPLPEPDLGDVPFARLVANRRSQRSFGPAALPLAQLAGILHAAYGRTHQLLEDAEAGVGPQFRSVPSGGALYPLELFAFARRVDGLEAGCYHFDPLRRVLEIVRVGDSTPELAEATVYREPTTACAVFLAVTATFWRTRFKYGLRGYRFALLEAGHAVQNALLAATSLGLAAVPLAGFYDSRMDALLGLDGVEESTVYAVAIGAEPAGVR
ncbi:MAG: SagB family peptide dehydrogenase [Actinomycetota bacterium]|nr:SagB family peptide dehydrogenase [Actinomycetota bacterium]